ncbi:alpha-glucosidase [Pontibacillus sp. ALD_SL1]|uniref:glycoside hydrolase family 13 protein n=1 Tax=Pontibacillus sp. ALD_SL1 TaxID=2777185 RepID=UPI001A9692C7|nr:alpha-glucosidase [Pontibacillus sp. ALD_SL1]QST01121.1 alpha-glucosidase [Pontibacillus sp. ALD_SL1]
MGQSTQWWKNSVVYQIYPRSFNDSNGDGIGDLEGIIEKLDYLVELGIDVIWLSPIYKSPNDDNGYDISDYQDIMTEFGDLETWDRLITTMHEKGLKLVMDLVVNHTSDEHPWFQEAKKSKDNPYRDFYIWRPPNEEGKEPNNWLSFFSGSAWEYHEPTGEYYLHLFTKKQPDLNWENPDVRQKVYEMMRWWLDRGVDGFRMDVINLISKVEGLPDAPVTKPDDEFQWGSDYFANGPRFMEFMQEMKEEVLDHYDILTVGETGFVTPEEGKQFTNEDSGVLSMLFQFQHMDVDAQPGGQMGKWEEKDWKLTELKEIMSKWQVELFNKGWNSLYLENHDQPRSVSRFGDDGEYHAESAKMLATWLHMMQGTPYVYQGQEIGMTNVHFPSIEDYEDVEIRNLWQDMVVEKGHDPDEILKAIHEKGRDNARTPMQWDASDNAGFTSGTPWLKVNPNYDQINVEKERENPDSIFHYYKKLIALRKEHEVIVNGDHTLIWPEDEEVYAYKREHEGETLVVVTNWTGETVERPWPEDVSFDQASVMIHNYSGSPDASKEGITLRPYEAVVYHQK